MAINKIIYGGTTLIDLTADDVTASDVAYGKQFHLRDGEIETGTNTYDADTSDANALAGEILNTKTAYVNGTKITGTMPNRGAISGTISTVAGTFVPLAGYYDGSGSVSIDSTEQDKIIATNIREGVEILGVTGTMTGTEAVTAESPTITPTTSSQTITPSSGYNYLAQVTVAAIPYTTTSNSYGTTVTIG